MEKKVGFLAVGGGEIVRRMGELPGTKHDLSGEGSGERFSLDAYPVGVGMVMVVVHGQFTQCTSLLPFLSSSLSPIFPYSSFTSFFLSFFRLMIYSNLLHRIY
jgi:hypothetical protein